MAICKQVLSLGKPNIMKRNITLLAIAILLFSCRENREQVTEAHDAKTYMQLEKANWFLGEWANSSPEGELTERWRKVNDSIYHGESYFVIAAKDTVFAETVSLEEANGKLAYVVTVPNQNDAKPVRFEMTSVNDSVVIFENPEHDFPNKIIYNKIGNDSLVAEISGMKDGKPSSEKFAMKKQ